MKTDGFFKVKSCTLVITSYRFSSDLKGKIKDERQTSSHPVTVPETDELEAETGSTEAPETLKNARDFQHGPANGKFLKCHFLKR